MSRSVKEIMKQAYAKHILVPAFNIAYIPMIKPIVEALRESETFGLVEVARLEVEKFGAVSFEAVAKEYHQIGDRDFTRLHLDHIPAIDEDGLEVNWEELIQEGIKLGFDSVMIDGSRLPFERNVEVTKTVVKMASSRDLAVEAELGAVHGHEQNTPGSYEEIFTKGIGFTDPEEARTFSHETNVDWLSVAVGSIHGAISGEAKDRDKVHARLNIEHLHRIDENVGLPLVLHGGSGIESDFIFRAIQNGITKINIGTEIRHAYERNQRSIVTAQRAVASKVTELIRATYQLEDSAHKLGV